MLRKLAFAVDFVGAAVLPGALALPIIIRFRLKFTAIYMYVVTLMVTLMGLVISSGVRYPRIDVHFFRFGLCVTIAQVVFIVLSIFEILAAQDRERLQYKLERMRRHRSRESASSRNTQ